MIYLLPQGKVYSAGCKEIRYKNDGEKHFKSILGRDPFFQLAETKPEECILAPFGDKTSVPGLKIQNRRPAPPRSPALRFKRDPMQERIFRKKLSGSKRH